MIGGRGEYRLGRGLPKRARVPIVEAFAPEHRPCVRARISGSCARWGGRGENGVTSVASFHTRFDTYFRYYNIGFVEPLIQWMLTRFYNRVRQRARPQPQHGARCCANGA